MRAVAAPMPRVRTRDDADPAFETEVHVAMKSHTVYRTFNTEQRREFVRITEDVQAAVDEAGIAEGMVLVAAMHITAAVWINDDEPGLHEDVARVARQARAAELEGRPRTTSPAQLLPDPGDYRHHRGGEDNGDAHLKNLLVHHQVIVPGDGRPPRPRARGSRSSTASSTADGRSGW